VTGLQARVIAFYLPQYHPIPENDLWWGKGFTEWTNVAKARPLFPGHYQPRIPADLGFYDLRVPETRFAQAEMARKHGIEGFCYWHYWFAGERLLERPFREVLRTGEPKFPFCLGWANQSWTGIWHGAPHRVLKAQTYPGLDDHRAHFYTLLEAFADERYMTVEGKPIFIVYAPFEIPEVERVTDFWRSLAAKAGLKGLHLVAHFNAAADLPAWRPSDGGFDAAIIVSLWRVMVDVAVSGPRRISRRLSSSSNRGIAGAARFAMTALRRGFRTVYKSTLRRPMNIHMYADAVPYFVRQDSMGFEYYPCIIPNWDNTPRSGLDGVVLHNSTPELFRTQVAMAVNRVRSLPDERRIIFVKSWNEWAEGNHLEPDLKFGTRYLEVLRDELMPRPTVEQDGPEASVPVHATPRG
jgi:hypothetical protein